MVSSNSLGPDRMPGPADAGSDGRSTRALTPRRAPRADDYDLQTGLINRGAFLERLADAVRHHRSHRTSFALLLLQMDDLDAIAERYGHGVCEQLIVKYATQLRTGVRSTDTVARLGTGQFAVILEGIMESSKAQGVNDRLAQRLGKPIMAKGALLQVLSDIGHALYPQEGIEASAILERADHAMRERHRARALKTTPSRQDDGRLTGVA